MRDDKFGLGFYAGLLVGGISMFFMGECNDHSYSKQDKVQQGYVVPSKLEIKLEDLDQNGEREVLMKYDGKSYLLKLDEEGKPQVQAYEITPK